LSTDIFVPGVVLTTQVFINDRMLMFINALKLLSASHRIHKQNAFPKLMLHGTTRNNNFPRNKRCAESCPVVAGF